MSDNPLDKSAAKAADRSSDTPSEEGVGRRQLLKGAALGAIATATGCAGGESSGPAVITQPRLNWRLVSSFPRSLDTIFGAAEVFAETVSKLTDERFQIRAYPSGELVPPLQVLDTVQKGTVQLGHTASYYYTGKNPTLAFDTAVPFGLTTRQQSAWLHEGGGSDLMAGIFSDFNIKALPGGNTGTQMGGWFRRAIESSADLKGLKMRIPGLGATVMDRLGVTVQTIAGGEIYPALERGAIDATEWVGPYDDEKLGFHQVAKYYYYPGWWEPGPNLSIYVHAQAWDELPSGYQEILKAAARVAEDTMTARYDALNPPALGRLLDHGVELRRFSDDILQAAQTQAFDLMEEEAAKDETYRKVFESWKEFRSTSYRWFSTSEQAFSTFAYGS